MKVHERIKGCLSGQIFTFHPRYQVLLVRASADYTPVKMLKLSLFLLLAVVLLMPDDAAAWRRRRWRIRVRVPRVIRTARNLHTAYQVGKLVLPFVGRDVGAADVNNDAVLETAELTSLLGERATAEDVEELIRMADDDGDGKVTRRELEDFVSQLELE